MSNAPEAKLDIASRRWSLREPALIAETATSWVLKAVRGHSSVVLKILKPFGADEIRGAGLMAWYDGDGAAQVYDTHDQMILMEWLNGPPVGDLARSGRDEEATDILCEVASVLHRSRSAPLPPLEDLAQRFEPLFASHPHDWPPARQVDMRRAAGLARHLLQTSRERIPLHGDFHHDNIVHSPRGWLVIDPKGVIGDPAYEFSNVFRNPLGGSEIARRPERIDRVARHAAAALRLDRARVLGWAAAHSALSACWDRSAGKPYDWDMTLLPLLFAAIDRNAE